MTKYIISRGDYVVHTITVEAADYEAAIKIAKTTPLSDSDWNDCGSDESSVLFQCEGEIEP